jgi:hypothetical protein
MSTAVIGLPISNLDESKFGLSDGWPDSWLEHGLGPTKNIRWMGNARYSKASVRSFLIPIEGVGLAPDAHVKTLIQIRDSDNFNYVVAIIEYESNFEKIRSLLKLGNSLNSKLFWEKLGIRLDGRSFVNATCVTNDGSKDSLAKDGILRSIPVSTDFYFQVAYGLGVAGITAERLLIEIATQASFKSGLLAGKARKALSLTENWLSIPASDSTQILIDLARVRESLQLDQRMALVRRSLTHQAGRVNQLLGFALSIPTFLATSIAAAYALGLKQFETLISIAIAIFAFIAIFAIGLVANRVSR